MDAGIGDDGGEDEDEDGDEDGDYDAGLLVRQIHAGRCA